MKTSQAINHDVLIIGGGPAGLSAALYLGRARQRVLVLDAQAPRHAVSEGVHNFLTRDGLPPAQLRTIAWEQLQAYPTVAHQAATITSLDWDGQRWSAQAEDGLTSFSARAVILAMGMADELPAIEGIKQRWGRSVQQCPYCHGWELRDQPLAILSDDEQHAIHMAPLLKQWSEDLVVLTHGVQLGEQAQQALRALNIPLYTQEIAALEGAGHELERIILKDGSSLARQGLFIKPKQRQVALVRTLGLELNEHGFVQVDAQQLTSAPRLWAAGDLTSGFQQVLEAAAQGARAAVALHRGFVFEGVSAL